MSASLSPTFLADLANVYAALRPPPLSAAFLSDLKIVYDILPVASDANLLLLANRFLDWRSVTKEFVRNRLVRLSDDDPLRCPISLFRTMDSGRLEVAHTRTLAWLLDPNKEHGFGTALLAALLGWCTGTTISSPHVHVDYVAGEYPLEGSAGKGRLDVLAKGQWESAGGHPVRWILVIEAKIGAWESEGQLGKYDKWLLAHAEGCEAYRIFLTPDGREPEGGCDDWKPLRFLKLVQIFRRAYGKLGKAPGFHFLRFYLAGVIQDVCHLRQNVGDESADDPYAVASYLKTAHESLLEVASHDALG
jgi:hypothetical protein